MPAAPAPSAPSAPPRYAVGTSTRVSSIGAAVGLVALGVLAVLPAFVSRSVIQELFFVFTMLALAQYWNLLAGYAGLVSVGQQAFVGLGGYTLFAATVMAGLDPVIAVLAGGLVAGLLAVPTAFLVFRLRGAYFAIGTWVVAEVFRLVLAQDKQLGGGTGTSLPADVTRSMLGVDAIARALDVRSPAARDIAAYWGALVLVVVTLAAIHVMLRSRRGLGLSAIRDSELTAESVGVDAFASKVFVYIVTACGTGMTGALIYLQKARISPDAAFSLLDWTADVIFIVVIGGIGTIEGPILGTMIFYLLQVYLSSFGSWYLIFLGALAILIMLVAPGGIWGLISQRFDVHLFPVRRRLVVPDTAAKPRPEDTGPP
ncbi:MAG TPA: branched-chain amino acid ABC transporter permease [Xanthobacteraceae bacterium]|nr:branched-chain amino acid ABC transporter permease [Xanthobacteraceae bacterium]